MDPQSLTVDKSIVEEMSALYQKVASLEEENNELRTRCLTLENIKDDNKKFQCFTGLPNYATFKALFDYLDSAALQKRKTGEVLKWNQNHPLLEIEVQRPNSLWRKNFLWS